MDVEKFFANKYDGTKRYTQHNVANANATGFGAAADDYAERGSYASNSSHYNSSYDNEDFFFAYWV